MYVTTDRPREDVGWREGRPVEDPEKTKRWGFVTAKPSEFLVHVRNGAVRSTSSGQGATCFKRPRDAVAVIPTSLQRLQFLADQVTVEKVGVEIVGLAVYRIADPLVAYRVLNFSYPERAQEKLEQTLSSMLVGATRRLVANLSVEDCLQKRKRALADELLAEVAPVLGGTGRPDDASDQGWGVVLDTIEIQEVRVLSEKVFAAMQAPYRMMLQKRANAARGDAEREGALAAAENKRAIETARIQAELKLREEQRQLSERDAAARRERELREAAIEEELATQRMTSASQQRRTQLALDIEEARAEREVYEARELTLAKEAGLVDSELSIERARRELRAELDKIEGLARAAVDLESARAERERAEAKARELIAENLPQLAQAVGQRFGEVKVTQIGGDAFGQVAQALTSVLAAARDA
jgi:hypothetical protein